MTLRFLFSPQTLEDARIWKHIKRVAGTGMGGLMATLLAADYTAQEVEDLFVKDIIGKFEGEPITKGQVDEFVTTECARGCLNNFRHCSQ